MIEINLSSQFQTQKDLISWQEAVALFGEQQAQSIETERVRKNIHSQIWEGLELADPYPHSFHLYPNEKLVVHESNLDTKKDIRSVVDRQTRRGTEGHVVDHYAEAMLNETVGKTIIWASPKAEASEEVDYPCALLNIATKKTSEFVFAQQYLLKDVNTSQLALLFSRLAGSDLFGPEPALDDVITKVAVRDGGISTQQIKQEAERVLGLRPVQIESPELMIKVESLAESRARRYVEALQKGTKGGELDILYSSLLSEILKEASKPQTPYSGNILAKIASGELMTSCGPIRLSTSSSGSESGGIKCKNCGVINVCNKYTCFLCLKALPKTT